MTHDIRRPITIAHLSGRLKVSYRKVLPWNVTIIDHRPTHDIMRKILEHSKQRDLQESKDIIKVNNQLSIPQLDDCQTREYHVSAYIF